jgi:hypothetical protein
VKQSPAGEGWGEGEKGRGDFNFWNLIMHALYLPSTISVSGIKAL